MMVSDTTNSWWKNEAVVVWKRGKHRIVRRGDNLYLENGDKDATGSPSWRTTAVVWVGFSSYTDKQPSKEDILWQAIAALSDKWREERLQRPTESSELYVPEDFIETLEKCDSQAKLKPDERVRLGRLITWFGGKPHWYDAEKDEVK